MRNRYLHPTFGDFKCIHCQTLVTADPDQSGVLNRNHCPYCLYSRHLDLYESGDRLAACKGPMRPIGLTLKKAKKKKYGKNYGELMLIHECVDCGRLSINRIAADDIVKNVYAVFEDSLKMDEATATKIEQDEIELLKAEDASIVRARLYGWSEEDEEIGA
jgi:hypothetical protein